MAQLWYYSDGKKVFGPVSIDELRRLAAKGEIRPDMHVCSEPDRRWVLASAAPGLFDGAAPEPKAPPVTRDAPTAQSPPGSQAASSATAPAHAASPFAHETPSTAAVAYPYGAALAAGDNKPVGGILDITFRRFATPKIIVIIWVLYLALAILALLFALVRAAMLVASFESVVDGLVAGLVVFMATLFFTALGLLSTRMILEVITVLFRILERLEEINAKTPRDGST